MPSKTLWFNRGLFVQSIRNVGWVSLAYLLCLLFNLPLQILMLHSKEQPYSYLFTNYSDSVAPALNLFNIASGEFQVIFMGVFPVLLAVFLYRYMHVKLASDFVHSLPLKREHLFIQYTLYGILILVVPVLVTSIALFLLSFVLNISHILTVSAILSWCVQTIFFNIFIFIAGVFVAVFTGISVIHGALVYILLFFPAGIFTLVYANLDFYLFGLVPSYFINSNVEQLIPFIRAFNLSSEALTAWEVVIYTLIAVVAFIMALFVYKKRHAEMATQAVAVRPLRPVFVYGVTFCTMLVGGLYFGETQDESFAWILFGYITASILGYFIAQMILEKTWRVFDKWKGYLVFVVGVLLLASFIHFDISGFEKRVPDATDVESMYLDNYYRFVTDEQYTVYYDDKETIPWIDSMGKPFGRPLYRYSDPEVIELLRKLHLRIIEEQDLLEQNKFAEDNTYDSYGEGMYDYRSITLGYNLKNGSKVVRQYTIPYSSYIDILKPLYESREYKTNFYPLLRIDDLDHLDAVTFYNRYIDKRLTISDPQQLEELHRVIQKELADETVGELMDTSSSWSDIDYRWDNGRGSYAEWKPSYTELENWLKKYGYDQQIRITSSDVQCMLIAENPISDKLSTGPMATSQKAVPNYATEDIDIDPKYLPYEFANAESVVQITDKTIIGDCLPLINQKNIATENGYLIALYFNDNDRPTVFHIRAEQVPESVKELVDNQ